MSLWDNLAASLLIAFTGFLFGWIFTHSEIATECQRQGSFYVGDKDFKCEVIKR